MPAQPTPPTTRQIPRGWGLADLPDLRGRTAIVTGATSGIGLVTARELAGRGAAVTLAVRDTARGEQVAEGFRRTHPTATIDVLALDLADLSSVRAFSGAWSAAHDEGLDLLINNAGVMALPRRETPDGFEMQLATNHLGHFALTGLLLPALVARPRSRVVTVSSGAHRMGTIDFADLQGRQRYQPWRAYGQSKLANLLFTAELQRRLDANGLATIAVACHPGYTATNLQSAGPRMSGRAWLERPITLANRIVGQSPDAGALPTLAAATYPGLAGNSYVGPDGPLEMRGHPRLVGRSRAAQDPVAAERLWQESERLTGVHYPLDIP